MMILKTILFFFSLILPGWLLLKLFFPNQVRGGLKTLALSYGLGWGFLTVQLFVALFWLQRPLNNQLAWLFGLEIVILLALYLIVNKKIWQFKRPDFLTEFKNWAAREKVLLFLILLFAALVLGNCLVQPLVSWDSLVNWSLKAEVIVKDGGLVFDQAHRDYWLNLGNAGYPWNLSLSFAWLGFWLGGFNDLANNLLGFGFYLGVLILIYDFLIKRSPRHIALLFTWLAASAPLFIIHSFSAYGDLPLAFLALAGFIVFWEAIEAPSRGSWWLAGILAGLTTLTKNEGVFYVLAALPIIWLAFKAWPGSKRLGRLAGYIIGFWLAAGPWWLFKLVNHLSLRNTDTGLVWHPETILEIFKFWFTYEGFNIFWPIMLLVLIFNFRVIIKQRLLRRGWLYLLLVWLAFVYVYVFSKSYTFALDGTVILRNSLTFFPIAAALTALTFHGRLVEINDEAGHDFLSLPAWFRVKLDQSPKSVAQKKFLKFLVVGSSGALIDFGLLALGVEIFHWHPLPASILSFSVAVVNNFLFNKFWTWRSTSRQHIKQFAKYGLTSVAGLGLNTFLMWLGLLLGWHYLLVKVFVSVAVAFWNYLVNNFWTFGGQDNKMVTNKTI